ncbi:MAG: VOC family protein [Enterococcus sp.]
MNLTKIHHVAIITTNYQAARHFYVDLLELPIIRENYRPERNDYKLDLQVGTSELEIFGVDDAPKRPNYPEAAGLRHLAFQVDDLEGTILNLQKKGIACEAIRCDEYSQKRFTFFKDPDGLPLELHE